MPYVPSPSKRRTSVQINQSLDNSKGSIDPDINNKDFIFSNCDENENENEDNTQLFFDKCSTSTSKNNINNNVGDTQSINSDEKYIYPNNKNNNNGLINENENENDDDDDDDENENYSGNILYDTVDLNYMPLSLSFIRKPSRSELMSDHININNIMKQNTLLNSRKSFDKNIVNHSNNFNEDDSNLENLEDSIESVDEDIERYTDGNVDFFDSDSPISPLCSQTNFNDLNLFNYSSPLVRKKSGELVKSSLKLNDNFRVSGAASMPSTPTYKQVHFGDNISVKYFNEKDKPNFISADNSPYSSDFDQLYDSDNDDDDDDENDYDADDDNENKIETNNNFKNFKSRVKNNNKTKNNNTNDKKGKNDTDSFYKYTKSLCENLYKVSRDYVALDTAKSAELFKKTIRNWNLENSNFKSISYRDKVDCEVPVFLETCFLNLDKTLIIGQIAVKNLHFTKTVKIRYTVDNWVTVINVDAKYTSDIPRVLKKSGYDRFIFELSTPVLLSSYFKTNLSIYPSAYPKIDFCIKYTAGGREYWDNNYMKNYNLLFIHNDLSGYESDLSCSKKQDNYFTLSKNLDKHNVKNKTAVFDNSVNLKNKNQKSSTNYTVKSSTLKKSKSFDKKNDAKSIIASLDFSNNNLENQTNNNSIDKTEEKNIEPISLNFKHGSLKYNFQNHNKGKPSKDNVEIKNENESVFEKLKIFKDKGGINYKELKSKPKNIIKGNDISDKSDGAQLDKGLRNKTNYLEVKDEKKNGKKDDEKKNDYINDISSDMVDSETYQNLLKKYCFFKGPSNVSSFLSEKPDASDDIYDENFY